MYPCFCEGRESGESGHFSYSSEKSASFFGGWGGGVSKAARPFLGTESSVPQNGAKVGRCSAWHRTEVTQSGCFTDLVQEIPLTVLGAH